jgi:hypothetical protein
MLNLNQSNTISFLLYAAQDQLLPLIFHVINHYASDPALDPKNITTGVLNVLKAIDESAVRQEKVPTYHPLLFISS